uniref:PDZ domain-containing protein n=2 Tax=Ciona savignyi TaxID=51511 RepID=H2ZI95_CIOSA
MATPRIQTSVTLFGSPPWGFRISGGKEYNQPLVFTRITPGSLAARSGLTSGDVLIAVNGQHVADMTQDICETKIKQAVGSIQFVIQKNAAVMSQNASGEVVLESDRSVYVPRPTITSKNRSMPMTPQSASGSVPEFDPSVLKRSATSKQAVVMKGPGSSKVVHAQYNTPMGMYSNDNIMDTVQAQAQSKGVSLPGASTTATSLDPDSAVFREVHRQSAGRGKSNQSRSFKMLQTIVDVDSV